MAASGYAAPGAVNGVTIAFTVVAAIVVSLRLFTRLHLVHNGGLDDAFIVAALVFTIGLTICTCIEAQYGIGVHQATLSKHDAVISLKALYASIVIYNIALLCVKYSILLQYLRIFPHRGLRTACYVLMGIVGAYTTWCFWSAIFLCTPIATFWNPEITGGHCLNRQIVWFFNAGFNIVTDIATAILPLPKIRQLSIAKKQKVALMVVFALGGFTCIISVLRLESIYALTTDTDQSYNNGQAAMWSSLEVNVGIICSCLPTLKALATRFFPRIFTTYQHSYGSTGAVELSRKYGTYGSGVQKSKSNIRHDELGRGLTGRHEPVQRAYISRGSRQSMDINIHDLGASPGEIKVVTVVNQEVESGQDQSARSEHGSERQLVYGGPFYRADGSGT